MSAVGADVIQQFEARAKQAEEMVATLTEQVDNMRALAEAEEVKRLEKENEELLQQVEAAKIALIQAEVANGKAQVELPGKPLPKGTPLVGGKVANGPAAASSKKPAAAAAAAAAAPAAAAPAPAAAAAPAAPAAAAPAATAAPAAEKPAKEKKAKAEGGNKNKAADAPESTVDISRLSLIVGKIVKCERHPDPEATKLYVEQIDLGEGKLRTVLSGLADKIPIEEMQNRMVICCANMKPRPLRGIESQAMVMCGSTEAKVEFVEPPAGSVPGDRVEVAKYPGEADKELNPKKKVLETVLPDLSTNDNCEATYKGSVWEVKGKGVCKVQTLKNVPIK